MQRKKSLSESTAELQENYQTAQAIEKKTAQQTRARKKKHQWVNKRKFLISLDNISSPKTQFCGALSVEFLHHFAQTSANQNNENIYFFLASIYFQFENCKF